MGSLIREDCCLGQRDEVPFWRLIYDTHDLKICESYQGMLLPRIASLQQPRNTPVVTRDAAANISLFLQEVQQSLHSTFATTISIAQLHFVRGFSAECDSAEER